MLTHVQQSDSGYVTPWFSLIRPQIVDEPPGIKPHFFLLYIVGLLLYQLDFLWGSGCYRRKYLVGLFYSTDTA